jgi:hypothetical protein
MHLRVYEVLLQFNRGMDQALESLNIVEELELASPEGVSRVRTNLSELRSYANNHFASKIAQKKQEEENNFYRIRRNREKAEEGPNEIHLELKAREELRCEQGLPPRAVILPWTQADDDRILAMQKAASSSLPTQPEQPRVTGDSEQQNQKGGTPTWNKRLTNCLPYSIAIFANPSTFSSSLLSVRDRGPTC